MSTTKGSFAQRMASMASTIENWDDDVDFQGDLFAHSIGTVPSLSSRVSVRSESNTGDDDWQVLITPNDELSTRNAISSAKQAGIPIPTSVPSSALLGGSIKRLGKKKSNRKIAVDDDWGNDLELPSIGSQGLKLKVPVPHTPAEDHDDFDDWGEGSLGIRFAGTRRDTRGGRSSSVSAMSPSLGSCMTLESEDDDLVGLVLPTEPLDFNARLEKLKKTDHVTPDVSPLPAQQKRDPPPTSAPALPLALDLPSSPGFDISSSPLPPAGYTPPHLENSPIPKSKPKPADDDEDFLEGLDFGVEEPIDTKKLTLNRNLVIKKQASKPVAPPAARPATTITFTDKPSASRIPRPLPSSSRTRLTPVYESGASNLGPSVGLNRPMPTTTSAQLLRAKRSAPALRNSHASVARPPVPFLPAGSSNSQSHHVMAKNSQTHLRRDSDPRRPQSPSMRSYSRMSSTNPQDTPSRAGMRRDAVSTSNLREGAMRRKNNKSITMAPRKLYGDGMELEVFDDLPTSATKEKQFEKVPKPVSSNRSLRHLPSVSKLPMPDRITTPLPQTPRSPTKMESTPRFARDTAASRIAREQRLAGTRSRGEGPIAPTQTNWKAQVAARSPHASPTAHRKRGTGQKPQLISGLSMPFAKKEKGMTYNPTLQRWEGNEEALVSFAHPNTSTTTLALTTASTPTFAPPNHPFAHTHDRSHSISHTALSNIHAAQKSFSSRVAKMAPVPTPSPPRPALISQISQPRGVQIQNGMQFDPVKMKWMKAPRRSNADSLSPSVADEEEEEDPFAGLEDLKDSNDNANFGGSQIGGMSGGETGGIPKLDEAFVGEEFDLGPSFIRRQREEENNWRKRTEGWVGVVRDSGERKPDGYRWSIRHLAALASAEASRRY
ncbi:hypothetical protein BU24DRAFT_462638 [Aaosphaeria arxii CBS 175.79]|uniref:Cytokinesis regulator n=1 Tax=Aaosphaeria arxii CBS 175.79 TaxID=1450172 RepID=A0A6A5XV33_9PLEO|nr:uncharacterized protein BU24DRAFT_462638 [Aaosphaeria arxii CBS 175.79]KAF2016490.1 hypothetical protein BU24DRAFT_462638 [Aaosphaeria arxii CBS 175.79]